MVLALVAAPAAPMAAAERSDRLPDLAMARPTDVRLVTSTDGRRRLRFTSSIVNIGDGPFETRAARDSVRQPTMRVNQRIYDTTGGYRVVATPAIATYAGDGHDHWHVERVAGYTLHAAGIVDPTLARSSKVGFCFFDTRPYRLTLPRAPGTRQYSQGGCGTRSAYSLRHGISVGWADRYGWELRYQAIDVTGLPAGEYLLKVSADPNGYFVERTRTNNCNWTRIRVLASGSNVTILGWGAGCVLPGAAPVPTPSPTPSPAPSPAPTPTPPPTPTP
jgi:hypothetical protein